MKEYNPDICKHNHHWKTGQRLTTLQHSVTKRRIAFVERQCLRCARRELHRDVLPPKLRTTRKWHFYQPGDELDQKVTDYLKNHPYTESWAPKQSKSAGKEN